MTIKTVDMSVTLGSLKLKNPVMPASGTFGYGEELSDLVDINELGAVITKGTSLRARLGNPPNRCVEVAGCCVLTGVGLQNVGVEAFIEEKLPYLRQFETPVIVNTVGESIEDFTSIAQRLTQAGGVSGMEINTGCPNLQKGKNFSSDPETIFELVSALRGATDLALIIKFSSGMADNTSLAKACEEAGADAICPGIHITGMALDLETRRSRLGENLVVSIGGPWKKPVCVKVVWEAAQAVDIPVIGSGGITCAEDALELFIAGATAVEIGTFNLIEPEVTINTIGGIRRYLEDKGLDSIHDLIGSVEIG